MKKKNKKLLYAPQAPEPVRPHFNVPQESEFTVGVSAQQPTRSFQVQSGYATAVPNGMPAGLPQFTLTDEYGRLFAPIVTYGALPHSAPVPVPIPSKVIQLSPIISPVSFVPYNTQNQDLYQFDDED